MSGALRYDLSIISIRSVSSQNSSIFMSSLIRRLEIKPRRLGVISVGGLLIAAALCVSNHLISRALLTDATRSLFWGPTLFRILLGGHGFALALYGVFGSRYRHSAASDIAPACRSNSESPQCASRWAWAGLIGLSILALALRVWELNSGLWFDEVITLLNFVRPPLGEIITSFPYQNQHMFYSVLAHVSIRVFGESAWALRLPSVLFGVGSLWALFCLSRRLTNVREALLTCALMTVSYHHIWFSQNARGYMGLLFFATLATWFWLEVLVRPTRWWWCSYIVAVSSGAWIHLTMVFVAAAHTLVYLAGFVWGRLGHDGAAERFALEPRLRWQPLLAWLLCMSVTLQLYALALPEFLRMGLHEVSLPSEWTNPLWVILEGLKSLQIGFSGVIVVLCGAGLVGVGWFSLLRRDWSMGIVLVLPAVLAGSTMLVLGHNLWPRFFFFSMGFIFLIVVHGAMTAPRLLSRIRVLRVSEPAGLRIGAIAASLLIVASAATLPSYYAFPKQDFASARDYVEQHRKADDIVVAVGLAGIVYRRYFAPHWSAAQTRAELNEVRRRTQTTTWLIYTLPVEVKAYGEGIWDVIEKDFEIVKVFPGTLGDGDVIVCRQRAATQTSVVDRHLVLQAARPDIVPDVALYWS